MFRSLTSVATSTGEGSLAVHHSLMIGLYNGSVVVAKKIIRNSMVTLTKNDLVEMKVVGMPLYL